MSVIKVSSVYGNIIVEPCTLVDCTKCLEKQSSATPSIEVAHDEQSVIDREVDNLE